jgi:two-component system, chemotaxis family, response regulator PixG
MNNVTSMTQITQDLLVLYQQRATGELVIMYKNQAIPQWKLYFYMGRLVYATGGPHPVRRWQRAFKKHAPELLKTGFPQTILSHEPLWELDIINQLLQEGLINSVQAKAIIQQIVQEVFFNLVEQRFLNSHWRPGVKLPHHVVFLSVEQMIEAAQTQREAWRSSGLGYLQEWMSQFSPELAPILRNPPQLATRVSPNTYQSMIKLLQGQLTLWDVSFQMKRPLADVIRVLMPFIRQGIIELREIPDLNIPPFVQYQTQDINPPPRTKQLIACIDDSPAIGQALENILLPQGYEVLTILNPLQGISILLDRKPDLLFLDLIMPNTNGYELCTFLRKTSTFQDTPIVILTGNDGVVDRVRAKLTGASEFLSKPPDAARVLQTIEKHLGTPEPHTAPKKQDPPSYPASQPHFRPA